MLLIFVTLTHQASVYGYFGYSKGHLCKIFLSSKYAQAKQTFERIKKNFWLKDVDPNEVPLHQQFSLNRPFFKKIAPDEPYTIWNRYPRSFAKFIMKDDRFTFVPLEYLHNYLIRNPTRKISSKYWRKVKDPGILMDFFLSPESVRFMLGISLIYSLVDYTVDKSYERVYYQLLDEDYRYQQIKNTYLRSLNNGDQSFTKKDALFAVVALHDEYQAFYAGEITRSDYATSPLFWYLADLLEDGYCSSQELIVPCQREGIVTDQDLEKIYQSAEQLMRTYELLDLYFSASNSAEIEGFGELKNQLESSYVFKELEKLDLPDLKFKYHLMQAAYYAHTLQLYDIFEAKRLKRDTDGSLTQDTLTIEDIFKEIVSAAAQ